MRGKVSTAISTIMVVVPWTILVLRENQWALQSPMAEILISCYAGFMIFSGIFTINSYVKKGVQNNLMKICLIINGMYAVAGAAVIVMMILPKIM